MTLSRTELTRIAVLFVLCAILWWLVPHFGTFYNLRNVLRLGSLLALLSFGMTFSLLVGGIDLSIGAVIALSGCVTAGLITQGHFAEGVIIGVLIGASCGLLNGVLIGYLGLPPFVATYGMMRIARGLAFSYTGGYCIYGFDPGFRWLGTGFIAGIPAPIFIALGMAVLLCFIAYRTVLGKEIYAVGANRVTAKYTGINVKKTLLIVYVMSGVLSAFAGFIYIARLNAAEPIIGELFVLDAVAATVIGGTSFAGGEGGPIGTVIGALIIAVLQNGLNLMGVPPQWQLVLIGSVIILAVTVDMVAKKV